MPDHDLIPILSAFLLGILLGRLRLWRLRMWSYRITDRLPARCPACKTWHVRHDMIPARHRAAGWVRICQQCYDSEYTPYTRGGLRKETDQ
jgi:hypothetical protein